MGVLGIQAIVMQNQVLKAQRQLEQALRDALEAREEINRRRQHAEVLVARLRVLQVPTLLNKGDAEFKRYGSLWGTGADVDTIS